MKLKIVCCDNMTPSPEIFNEVVQTILLVPWWLADIYCNHLKSLCPLKGKGYQYPVHAFCDHATGGKVPGLRTDTPVAWGVSHTVKDNDLIEAEWCIN